MTTAPETTTMGQLRARCEQAPDTNPALASLGEEKPTAIQQCIAGEGWQAREYWTLAPESSPDVNFSASIRSATVAVRPRKPVPEKYAQA